MNAKDDDGLSPPAPASVAIAVEHVADAATKQRAAALAEQLGLPLWTPDGGNDPELLLTVTADRLALKARRGESAVVGGRPVSVDLGGIDTRSAAGASRKQPLFRAVGLHRRHAPSDVTVADLTAGFGEDAWMLARFGCRVLALERHPVVAAMLEDAVDRAAAAEPEVASRIEVMQRDSALWLAAPPQTLPEVAYLDPMYPGPARRRAAQGKAMKLLRRLVGEDPDAYSLIDAALAVPIRRVVVKRPRLAPPLVADREPVAVIRGQRVRFDVYMAD